MESDLAKQMKTKICVQLLDEGTEVWRPVEASQLSREIFFIPETAVVPEGELWEFGPGTTVRCELKQLCEGKFLVAVEQVRHAV